MPSDHSAPEPEERIAIHCEATSFDAATAAPRVIAALPMRGNRILTSQALLVTLGHGRETAEAVERLRALIGQRPLVGYFLDFTATLVERLLGTPLPNPRIEVSALFYEHKTRARGKYAVDLRLDRLVEELDLPVRPSGDAYGTALAAALACLRLTPPGR